MLKLLFLASWDLALRLAMFPLPMLVANILGMVSVRQ